jgi:HPt (histidine-containing phosphotransfer) domain-containing protein
VNASSSTGSTSNAQSVDRTWIFQISEGIRNEYLPQLRALIAENEATALRRFGHTMKGLGRQFQLDALAEWGETFEKSAEAFHPEALQQQFEQFQAISQGILDAATSKTKES